MEVPPFELGAIEVLNGSSSRATAIRLGWTMFALDLFIAGILWRAWGRRASLNYLVLGLPLCFLIYVRLDLLSIALAVLGLALTRREHERSGGLLLAAAILTKVWPAVLLPLWLVQRRWRALTWSAAGLALGTMAWVWWSGWSGPLQVLTFRHASGWQVQSPVGNLVDILGKATAVVEQGSVRVASAPLWAKELLMVGLAICSSVIWIRASRSPHEAEGLGALAAAAALLAFSPLLSDQYVFWLLPWAAIAAAGRDQNVVLATFLTSAATAAMVFVPTAGAPGLEPTMVLVRNALLVAVLTDALRRLHPRPSAASELSGLDRPDLLRPVAL